MRAPYVCQYINGRCSHPECGAWPDDLREQQPTAEDYCAAGGHGYYGDHDDVGYCYCGTKTYPARPDCGGT